MLLIYLIFISVNQLYEKFQAYVTESQREELTVRLQIVEDWLYDEGEDETKGVYHVVCKATITIIPVYDFTQSEIQRTNKNK